MTGRIYVIKSIRGGIAYFGSTKDNIEDRLSQHQQHHRRYQKGKGSYMSSFKVLDFDDASIHLMEDDIPDDVLKQTEGKYITEHKCVMDQMILTTVNINVAGRFKGNPNYFKEYYKRNMEKLDKYHKDYREKNREKYNTKWYAKEPCTNCGKPITKLNMKAHMKTKICKKSFSL